MAITTGCNNFYEIWPKLAGDVALFNIFENNYSL